MVFTFKSMHWVISKYSHVWRTEKQNWEALQSSKLQVKAEFIYIYIYIRDLSTSCFLSHHLSFQTNMDTTLMTVCAWLGEGCYSPSSDVPVKVEIVRVSPVAFQWGEVSTQVFQRLPMFSASVRWVTKWYPSVHWVNQWHSSGILIYTGPASALWRRVTVGSIYGEMWIKINELQTSYLINVILINFHFRCEK